MNDPKQVHVTYTSYEPKKHSVRMQTAERLGGQHPLADMYIPRLVLAELGLSTREQNDPTLSITITFTAAKN